MKAFYSILAICAVAIMTIQAQPLLPMSINEPDTPQAARFPRSVAPEPQADASTRIQRQAGGHHDVVDFGAHTGDHGAFGWYADFPIDH